jgi:hypothetical protein
LKKILLTILVLNRDWIKNSVTLSQKPAEVLKFHAAEILHAVTQDHDRSTPPFDTLQVLCSQ